MRLAEIELQDHLLEEAVRKLVEDTMSDTSSPKDQSGSVTTAKPPTDFKTQEEIDVELRVKDYKPIKSRTHKVVTIPITMEDVINFLYSQLPGDIEIINVHYDYSYDRLNVIVGSEKFPEVDRGSLPPLAKIFRDVDPITNQLTLKWDGEIYQ